MCYIPVEQAVAFMPALPSVSPVLKNLAYVSEENLTVNETNGGTIFGGQPSLQQRNESFDIRESMSVHCGYVYSNLLHLITFCFNLCTYLDQ